MSNICNLEMEKVAVLMVVAEISRDDDNHALLPVLQDVAHLHHKFKTNSFNFRQINLLSQSNTVVKEVRQVGPLVKFR